MNKLGTMSLAAIFLLFSSRSFCQMASTVTIAEHYQTKKNNVAIFPANSRELFYGNERFTPSKSDIETAELALINQLASINTERHNQYDTSVNLAYDSPFISRSNNSFVLRLNLIFQK